MPASAASPTAVPLTAEEAEAIATAAALHHLRAASAGGPGEPERLSGWARQALLSGVDRGPHRITAWGDPNHWG